MTTEKLEKIITRHKMRRLELKDSFNCEVHRSGFADASTAPDAASYGSVNLECGDAETFEMMAEVKETLCYDDSF